jgi:hypothetical protein
MIVTLPMCKQFAIYVENEMDERQGVQKTLPNKRIFLGMALTYK